MRIVQINGSYGNSDSTGRTTKEMHRWFLDHGVESFCFVTRYSEKGCDEKNVFLFGNMVSFKMHSLLSHILGLQGYFSWYATRKMIRRLKQCNPDIIILRVLHNNSINFPELFSYISTCHIATIIVLHDCYFFTGHCVYFTQYNCMKWTGICTECPGIKESNSSWFFDTSTKCHKDKMRWVSAVERIGVIGVSDWITDEVKKSFFKRNALISRIYNWIDLEVFRPQDRNVLRSKYKIDYNKKVLLGVASTWSESKGLSCVINVATSIPESLILLVGKMPDSMNNLPSNIVCVGKIEDIGVLAEYYALSDVFINPSIQETFGKTTAEAISCGTPVVAYKTTACIELIGNDRGYCAKPDDKEDFRLGTEMVLKIGKDAYADILFKFSRDNFDKEKNLELYMKFFKTMLDNKKIFIT